MMKFRAFILFVILSLFIPTFVFANPLTVKDIVNMSYYSQYLKKTITLKDGVYDRTYKQKGVDGNFYTSFESAWIYTFLPVHFTSINDYDVIIVCIYENAGGSSSNGTIRAVVSSDRFDRPTIYSTNVVEMFNASIDGIFQLNNNIYMIVRVHRPDDPNCCPSKTELFELDVYKSNNKFYLIARQVNKFK